MVGQYPGSLFSEITLISYNALLLCTGHFYASDYLLSGTIACLLFGSGGSPQSRDHIISEIASSGKLKCGVLSFFEPGNSHWRQLNEIFLGPIFNR